jgi:AcrR family transcriptional regulator
MSPRPADPQVRLALLEAAARIVAEEGPGRLTLRRLANDVGTSTMAVYTHFGSMLDVRREVRREGFTRLGADLAAVEQTGDPVADYLVLGWAYYCNGTQNPNLYRAMFMDGPVDPADQHAGIETFEQCIAAARRCIEGARFAVDDPVQVATELWALLHGVVALELAHLLPAAQALESLSSATRHLFEAFGDDRRALGRSFAEGRERILATLSA